MDKNDNQEKKRLTSLKAFQISAEFGFVMALPLIGLGLLGKWMDSRYNSGLFLPLGIITSLIISSTWLYRIIKQLSKDIKNDQK